MVVVLPAGAHIPGPPPLRRIAPSPTNLPNPLHLVSAFLGAHDPHAACTLPIIAISVESTLPEHLKQRPTPCELGLVELTLEEGVVRTHHVFVDPGKLPRGFMHEAQYHSETHQIPAMGFTEGRTDYTEVYSGILSFVNKSEAVFTRTENVQYVQRSLDWLAEESRSRCKVQVLPLETLALELISLATGHPSTPDVRISDELRPQILRHISHFGCDYHAVRDIPICALSNSRRLAIALHSLMQKYYWELLRPTGDTTTLNRSALFDDKISEAVQGVSLENSNNCDSNASGLSASSRGGQENNTSATSYPSDDDEESSLFTLPEIFREPDIFRSNSSPVQPQREVRSLFSDNSRSPGLSTQPIQMGRGIGRGMLKLNCQLPRRPRM